MKNFSGRTDPREPTRIRALIDCKGKESPGSVLNLSRRGICVYLRFDIEATCGKTIDVKTQEMGLLTGIVRWARLPRVGVELQLSTNTDAKVESYYKQLQAAH